MTTIRADGSPQWMNSSGVLTAAADNVLCYRLAKAAHAAQFAAVSGDSIDRGLALLAELKRQGFGVIYQGEPSREAANPVNAGG